MTRAGYRGLLPLFGGLLVVHLCAGPTLAAIVQPSVAESGSVVVTAETAEVREGPAPSYSVITVVEKGEIFVKQGRTGGWYFIKINGDAFGWISGRAVGGYQVEASVSPSVVPNEYGYYPYSIYPGSYYGYYWGQPYISWEWYVYDRDRYRDHSREHDRDRTRDRYRDRTRDDRGRPDQSRSRNDSWRLDEAGPQGGGVSRDRDRIGVGDTDRGSDTGHRSIPTPRSSTPRFRGPFQHR
jgi:uncharacterized protein YraI